MGRLTKRENGHAHYPRCFEEPCGGVRETFFPEDIIQCDVPGPPPMVYDLKEALVTLTEVDKKIMTALGRRC